MRLPGNLIRIIWRAHQSISEFQFIRFQGKMLWLFDTGLDRNNLVIGHVLNVFDGQIIDEFSRERWLEFKFQILCCYFYPGV